MPQKRHKTGMKTSSREGTHSALRTVRETVRKRRRRSRKKAVRIHELSLRQHAFVREKILGMSDKDAALAAGYAPSMADNTKHKLWTPQVTAEFERLKVIYMEAWRTYLAEIDAVAIPAESITANSTPQESGAQNSDGA
jgi:hypothetical protein